MKLYCSRSREGAWIEIVNADVSIGEHHFVAPARERGLKYHDYGTAERSVRSRSREGAWIEIWDLSRIAPNVLTSLPRGSVD